MKEPLVYTLMEPVELGGKDGGDPMRITVVTIRPPKMKDLRGLKLDDPDWDWAAQVMQRCADAPRKALEEMGADDSYALVKQVVQRFFPSFLRETSGTPSESSQTDGTGDQAT